VGCEIVDDEKFDDVVVGGFVIVVGEGASDIIKDSDINVIVKGCFVESSKVVPFVGLRNFVEKYFCKG
jgi:hypothetical protein